MSVSIPLVATDEQKRQRVQALVRYWFRSDGPHIRKETIDFLCTAQVGELDRHYEALRATGKEVSSNDLSNKVSIREDVCQAYLDAVVLQYQRREHQALRHQSLDAQGLITAVILRDGGLILRSMNEVQDEMVLNAGQVFALKTLLMQGI